MTDYLLKILLLIILATLLTWFVLKASAQTPPPLPRMKPVLQSPKGAEFQASLRKVTAPPAPALVVVPKANTNLITWTGSYTQPMAFSVEWKPELTSAWAILAITTNLYSYRHVTATVRGFYRVGAFYP